VALGAVALAYAAFTLVGFGSAMIASGPLCMVFPVAKVIPMPAMLDFLGASLRGWSNRHAVAWPEFRQLLPGMLLGQLLGVQFLVRLPAAMAIGVFAGHHIDLRLTREQLFRLLNSLLVGSGLSLIIRYLV
jgi:uncharacterized membrane protein YfcA